MPVRALAPKINSILPYFGGKRTLAPRIVAELGDHKSYWEPFCGSLAVLLAKHQTSHETVNDMNGNVVNLANVLASDKALTLYYRLTRTLFSEELFKMCRAALRSGNLESLEAAYCFFVESWMGRNGVCGTRSSNTAFCVRFTSNGGDPAMRFRNAVESIPAWHQRLRGVWILRRDAFEIIERIEDKAGTVIYCDPPYLRKGASYVHDFAEADHARLAELLRRFTKTRVVVSYYDEPELRDMYDGWTFAELDATKAMVNQGMRDEKGATKAPEVLIINGPSRADGGMFQ
jgi:DNA adenine methylase